MEKSEIHSLELTFEDVLDDGWEQVYMDWQDSAVEELKAKYGDRIETISVFVMDSEQVPPTKLFNVQAHLEDIDEDLESSFDPLMDPASPTNIYDN